MIDEQWAFVALAGFWGWVFSSIGFILKAFPGRKLFIPLQGILWGGGIVIFFAIWLAGMLNA